MASKLADVVEGVKDAILPAPTYKTVVKRFRDTDTFAKALVKGDSVVANDEIGKIAALGIASGSTHEVESVTASVLILKGGKKILAEWFVPELKRRERVRTKADRNVTIELAKAFAQRQWDGFSLRVDGEIATAKAQVTAVETEVTRAQNKLKQAADAVAALERAKADGRAWPQSLSTKMLSLVDQKLFTNFEQIKEGQYDVFVAYTGPLWIEVKPAAGSAAKPEKVRGEYAMKIYPAGAPVRIVVENVAPGKLPRDVPYNEMNSGPCNVCFGGQNDVISGLIQAEDWTRALTMVRVYLEGNRSN